MTDREMLLHVFAGLGITPAVAGDKPLYEELEGDSVYLYAGHGNVHGYTGFHCQFEFDEAGKLTEVGVYE